MKKGIIIIFVIVALIGVFRSAPGYAQDGSLPTVDELDTGWNEISPGGDTICAKGTPYNFYVRPAESDKLMIYFQGGGACWDADTCGSERTYTATAGPGEAAGENGIFDLDNPENPLADYNMVFVSYCTGDVHTGDVTVTYEEDVVIEHQGFTNAETVLNWVYDNFTEPSEVFVTGCSAGAYGSIMHAPYIMNQYQETPVRQLGDAGVGVLFNPWEGLTTWDMRDNAPDFFPEISEVSTEEFINTYYLSTAYSFPDQSLAQVTSMRDRIQLGFYSLMGGQLTGWTEIQQAQLTELNAATDNFDSYVYGGSDHCILPGETLYTYTSDGVRFLDWFTAYVNGEEVDSVQCESCTLAETIEVEDSE